MSKRVFAHYPTVITQCPTGVYTLSGQMPAYMHDMLFATAEIAEEAKQEAETVLRTRRAPEQSKFADAYFSGTRLVK